jgi:hypothetical protein
MNRSPYSTESLYCDISKFHQSFIIDLGQIIPHIRELNSEQVHFNEYLMEYGQSKKTKRDILTVKMAMEHVPLYYKKMDSFIFMYAMFQFRDR